MKITKRFLAVAAMSASAQAFAMGYSDLKNLIETKDIRSVESLLPDLPSVVKEHFVLIHHGKGAQDSSPANPRTLLFGEDGRSVFAFNGDKTQKGFYDFEIREFNTQSKNFEYSFVSFDPKGGKPAFSKVNESKCLSCHGQNPVPIYGDYDTGWPGFYNDVFRKEEDITQAYADFVASMPAHPRYQFLNRDYMAPVERGVDSATFQPTNMLGKFEARYLALHIYDQFKKSPRFSQFKYSFLYLGVVKHMRDDLCVDNEAFTHKVQDRLLEIIKEDYGAKPWFKKVGVYDDFPGLVFGYHQTLEKYENPSRFTIMDFGDFGDGIDSLYASVIVVMLQDEMAMQTDIGVHVALAPNRMTRYYGQRYEGEPSRLLDSVLTFAEFPTGSFVCDMIASKAAAEIAL